MHEFKYRGKNLYCENVKIKDLADKFSTPLYVYSAKTILDHFFKIKKAFSSIKPLICYSVKANSNLSILKLLINAGSGLDIVSSGELFRAKKIKCPPKKIVYASVGKTDKEIEEAVKYGILMFIVESLAELKKVDKIAKRIGRKVKISLRINPGIDSNTHNYITTGKKENKFGIDIFKAKEIFLDRAKYNNLSLEGVHIHIGSQITKSTPFIKAVKKIKSFIKRLSSLGICIKYLNIGGGLGIVYDKEKPQTADEFAKKILPLIKGLPCKLIIEPGVFIAGNAGILVTKVIYLKKTPL